MDITSSTIDSRSGAGLVAYCTAGRRHLTIWRNRTEEAHLFLVPRITEFDFIYRWWAPEGEVLPPLEPGTYRVHAVDATGCEATTMFRVTT